MLDTVMTVDDDSMGQMLSEIIMSDQNFCESIVKLNDGKMALEYFEQQANLPFADQKIPALVLLDINMPVLDGWDFLAKYEKEFKALHPLTKIIVLTSSIDPLTEAKANEHPLVFKYIVKPLEPKHIAQLKDIPEFSKDFYN
jgi:CheY-like chemotaxis protein